MKNTFFFSLFTCSVSLYFRWQVQNPHSTKDRFYNTTFIISPFGFNSWSNFSTMLFGESQRYVDMSHNISCADFRLHVESRKGNSYARMVPRGNKDSRPRITNVMDSHQGNPFSKKDLKPQTWTQATQILKTIKEDTVFSNKVSVSTPNVQYAESVITEPYKHEMENKNGYEMYESQPSNANLTPRKSTDSSTQVNQKRVESKQNFSEDVNGVHRQFPSQPLNANVTSRMSTTSSPQVNQKLPESKQNFSEDTHVNGVHQKDLKCDDLNETYIVPLDSKYATPLQKKLNSIYEKVLVVDNIVIAKEVVKKLTTQYCHLVHACDTEACISFQFRHICFIILHILTKGGKMGWLKGQNGSGQVGHTFLAFLFLELYK